MEPNQKSTFWESLFLRVLSVLVLLPIAIAAMWYGSPYFEALVSIIVVFISFEWVYLICHKLNLRSDLLNRLTFHFMLTLVGLIFFIAIQNYLLASLVFLSIFASLFVIKRKIQNNVYLWWGIGIFLLGIPFMSILWLRLLPEIGRELIFFLLFVTWATDSVAFFVGNFLKGPKLSPKISPNKTWSGALGGLVAGSIMGGLAPFTKGFDHFASFSPKLMIVALLLAFCVEIGDLLESWAKRYFGVKDTSNLIPGHGGFLDRLDGLLIATPVLVIIAYFFKDWFVF